MYRRREPRTGAERYFNALYESWNAWGRARHHLRVSQIRLGFRLRGAAHHARNAVVSIIAVPANLMCGASCAVLRRYRPWLFTDFWETRCPPAGEQPELSSDS